MPKAMLTATPFDTPWSVDIPFGAEVQFVPGQGAIIRQTKEISRRS